MVKPGPALSSTGRLLRSTVSRTPLLLESTNFVPRTVMRRKLPKRNDGLSWPLSGANAGGSIVVCTKPGCCTSRTW